jgi:adenylate cyclase
MPSDTISPDPETDYFSDGLTEELMARLSLVSEIELISRWASKQMGERKSDVRAIKEELGRATLLGSFRRHSARGRCSTGAFMGLTLVFSGIAS